MSSARTRDRRGSVGAWTRDAGSTLIEQLISIVLVGTVAVAVLGTVRVTTLASGTDRDQANVYAWLQAGSDEIHNGPRMSCTHGRSAVIAAYDALVKQATPPDGWSVSGASIAVTNVQFLGRTSESAPFSWSDGHCFESASCPAGPYCESPLLTQKVTIRATPPKGGSDFVLETIKSG